MYRTEFEANAKGFIAASNISRNGMRQARAQGFGLFHLLAIVGAVSIASVAISALV